MKRATTWAFQGAKLGDLVVSFGWQIVAARLLAPSEFGQVAIATALATFIVIVASLGGDELVSSAPPHQTWSILCRELKLRSVAIAAMLSGALILAVYSQPIAAATLTYSAAFAASSIIAAYNAREYQAGVMVCGVAVQGAFVIGVMIMIHPETGSETMLIVAAAVALRAVITFTLAAIGASDHRPSTAAVVRPTLAHRFSLVASASSGPLLGRQMHVSIAAIVGVSLDEIAAYSVAYSLAYLASTATILGIAAVALPQISDAVATGDRDALARRWKSILTMTSALSIPALGISAAAAPELIGVIYGPEYAATGGLLYVGLAGVLILQRLLGGGANNAVLIATSRTRALMASIISAAAIVVALDFLLMPLIGMWAAIISGAISILVSGLIMLVIVRRIHGGSTPVLAQVKVLAVTMSGAALVLVIETFSSPWPPIVTVAFALLIGLVSLLAVKRVAIGPVQ